MGKKPYGKRLLRLDKSQRAEVSSGKSLSDSNTAVKSKQAKGGKKGTRPQQNDSSFADAAPQLHAIKRMIQTGMAGPRSLGIYSNRQSILLVGEGDFTFSLALASVIGGSKLVCTSLDKLSQMQVMPNHLPYLKHRLKHL
jgi:hypothetical protein